MRTALTCVQENPKTKLQVQHTQTSELTLLIGSVFYVVGSISEVSDHGVCAAARRVADEGFDVVTSGLRESTSVHSEVCGRLAENT